MPLNREILPEWFGTNMNIDWMNENKSGDNTLFVGLLAHINAYERCEEDKHSRQHVMRCTYTNVNIYSATIYRWNFYSKTFSDKNIFNCFDRLTTMHKNECKV